MANNLARPAQACILVVEDEFIIRWTVAEALRDAGYTVIEAVDGDEALDIIQTGVTVDLVFSDVKMPGAVDGLGLLGLVKTSHPHLPVLLTSGHCDPTLALAGGADHFVRKPYTTTAVVALVRDRLGS